MVTGIETELLTQGERYTLEQKLKKIFADEDCFIYVQPNINSMKPDFIVIGKNIGVLIIEVKDWDDQFIVSVNKSVIICKTNKFKNPVSQVSTYHNIINSKLSGVFDFIDNYGKLTIPLKSVIFYVNLSDNAIEQFNDLSSESITVFSKKELRTLTILELIDTRNILVSERSILAIIPKRLEDACFNENCWVSRQGSDLQL